MARAEDGGMVERRDRMTKRCGRGRGDTSAFYSRLED